ncbi:hypothetical protein DM01DRAFT_1334574 [Hesseltinella vesiculosa]|uniref:N-terminal of MaoC-like dehydratase domain-containing protein n=1 Tax=Hesseltinella vesiculosa TaxID=101127 RepID=A0A1X2GMC6_9FUNG|nr:hypothetical protein DM01DRAFT_1334574 [Hesseltinella vesiculosa]
MIDEWEAATKKKSVVCHDTITASPVNLMANTLDEPSVDYKDGHLPANGTILPATWHHLFFPPRARERHLAADGYETDFFPPAPFSQRMWAGASLTFSADQPPLVVGDDVVMVSSLDHCDFRPASRLGDAVFVYINKDIYRKHDDPATSPWVMREQRCLVYSENGANIAVPKPLKANRTPEFSLQVDATPIQLFRYSALTFNAHRIHYDQHYCIHQEHHPDCLVHGPLSSTWMITLLRSHLAEKIALDRHIRNFQYRCLAPLYMNMPFTVCGRQTSPEDFELWVTNHNNHLAVKGTATVTSP